MKPDTDSLVSLFARAAEDLLSQPTVKSRLALLFRDLADVLDAPQGAAIPPSLEALERKIGGDDLPDEAPVVVVGDGLPHAQDAIDPVEEEPDVQLDADEAKRLLQEGMGLQSPIVPGVISVIPTYDEPSVPMPSTALSTLAQRFAVKAEACKGLSTTGQPSKALAERAQKLGASIWMTVWMKPERLEWMQHLGLCFEAGAEAALLLERTFPQTLDTITHRHQDVLDAAAHATSLMLSATFRMQGKNDLNADPDVREFHRWLEYLTNRHQIFQERYMKLNALASLKSLPEAQNKLAALKDTRGKAERELLNGLKAYLKQIAAEAPETPARRLKESRFLEKVESAKELGWQPSRLDLRKLLSAWYDALPRPERPTPFYAQLLDYVDAQYREQPADEVEEDEEDLQPSKTPNIDRVRMLLNGKALYIVGGNPVPAAIERIKNAFGLTEVIWPTTSHNSSVESLRATVSRPDVAAVLLLIRFSSHTFGQLIEDCERARKPFVRIPSGYGVKQIAYQILAQASQQLT